MAANSPIQVDKSEYNLESFYELVVYSEWRQDPISWNNLLKRTCSNIEKPRVKKNWFGFRKTSAWPEQELLSYWYLQLPWLISVCSSGQYLALLQDAVLEIRTPKREYSTIIGRVATDKDKIPQCRRMVWSSNGILVAISSSEGIVSVYDFLADHLFTMPKPAQKSGNNKRYVVGLEFINSPLKLDEWAQSLIVVYSDGMLHLYHVPEEGSTYTEVASVNLSSSGRSSATFCQKYQVLFISTKPINVPVSFKDNSVSAGISGWKMITKPPYFNKLFPTQDEENIVNRVNYSWWFRCRMKSMSCVAKMVVSPQSNWIVSYHCCGSIRVWYNPSLRLHRRWDPADRKDPLRRLEGEQATSFKSFPNAVDIEWITDEALLITWNNGTISAHNVYNFDVTYGSDSKLVHGRLRISTSLASKGFLALEYELAFISVNVEDADEKSDRLNVTSEFAQAVLSVITDNIDNYKAVRRPNQLTIRIYRLLGIKSVTPDERYVRYIEDNEFDEALTLAKSFKLDVDKVYQKQWKVNPVSPLTISEYLMNIRDEAWILQECVTRVPETLSSLHLLLEFALNRTDFEVIFPDVGFEKRKRINIKSLTDTQILKIKTRLLIFKYLEKLKIYELILQKQNLQYDMNFYGKIRKKHMVEIAVIYAHEGNAIAVHTILKERFADISPYLLTVLSNFPETLDPQQYSEILPKSNTGGAPVPFHIHSNRSFDWVESTKFRCLIEEEQLYKVKGALLMSSECIAEWYRSRAIEIERMSGIVENSVNLLRIGKSYNVPDLDQLLSEFLTLEILVLKLQFNVDYLTFRQWPMLDRGLKLLEKSNKENINENILNYFIPFLNRCSFQFDKERFQLFLNVLIKKSETEFNLTLQFFRFILSSNDNISVIGDVDEFVFMVNACHYSYEKLDLLSESSTVIYNVISLLNSLPDRNKHRTSLKLMYTIRDELIAVDILQRYKIFTPIILIHKIKHSKKEFTEIISDMNRLVLIAALKSQDLNTVKLEKLLQDILYLQEICFTSFSIETCYELFASAMLGAKSIELIEFATNFICCRKEEESLKNVRYNKSIELILKAARNYFDYSRSHLDEPMFLAKACLNIVKDENSEIMKELDLIQAVRIMSDFGVSLLPLQIRNCEDRMKLIEYVISKQNTAYKHLEKLYKLATKLSIYPNDHSKRYSIINIRLAEESFNNEDYNYCSELCENIMASNYSDGWDICLKLGSSLEMKDCNFKLKLLEFAYIYAPSKVLYSINEKKKTLEKSIIFNKLCNYDLTSEIVSKFTNGLDVNSKCLKFESLITKHSQKETVDRPERRIMKPVNLSNRYQITFEIVEYILKSLYVDKSDINEITLTVLDRSLEECGKCTIFNDNAFGLYILTCITNKNTVENTFATMPSESSTYQLAMYFYSILKCFDLNVSFLDKSPKKVVELMLNSSHDYLVDIIIKYKMKNHDYLQAKIAIELNCGIDAQRFISDTDYRRDTILGLAMSVNLENALIAVQLAEQNDITTKETVALHLESFLRDPSPIELETLQKSFENSTIANIIKEDPEFFKTRLLNFFEYLNGRDYSKLSVYFTILNEIDCDNCIIHSLTAKQHLKLMKKVKATSQAIDYLDLISHKHDLIEILQPALFADNFSYVIKLMKHLPECIRGNFTANILYRKKAIDEFFLLDTDETSLKYCIKQVESIFNNWLNKVDVSDIEIFMNETVWNRKVALEFHYEYRRQIILALVSWISNKHDFKENVKYLTNLIQERLNIMDKIWNLEEHLPISDHLKSYLFDLEEIGNSEEKTLKLLKQIAYDSMSGKDDLYIAYRASGIRYEFKELFQIFDKDNNESSDSSADACSEQLLQLSIPPEIQ